MSENPAVSIIIPALNEAETIGDIVGQICSLDGADNWEVIVVDDGSSDDTGNAAKAAGAVVVRHQYNLGNGASIRSGAAIAKGEITVFMDGDGQHPPSEIPRMLENLEGYDMVVASRTRNSKVSRFRRIGNRILISIAEFLSGHKIMDLTSGFRAVRTNRLREFVHLFPQRYSYPTTLTLSMLLAGYFVMFLPMDTIQRRETGTSNIRPFRDGVRFLSIIMRIIVLFNPQKVFMPIALSFMALGLVMLGYNIWASGGIEQSTMLALVFGLFIFLFGILAEQVSKIRLELHMFMTERNRRDD